MSMFDTGVVRTRRVGRQSNQQTISVAYPAGPGDVVSGASFWYGLRAYSRARIGNNAIRLIRASDSVQQDFKTNSDGNLDIGGINTFIGTSTAKVVTWYDQTTNGRDVTQATDANRPDFILNSDTFPTIFFDGASLKYLQSSATITQAQPFSQSAFELHQARTQGSLMVDSGLGVQIGTFNPGANSVFTYGGTVLSATAADNAWHALQCVYNGASSDCNVDGTAHTGAAGADVYTAATIIIGQAGSGQLFIGHLCEVGMWPSTFSAANSTAMSSQQHGFYGV